MASPQSPSARIYAHNAKRGVRHHVQFHETNNTHLPAQADGTRHLDGNGSSLEEAQSSEIDGMNGGHNMHAANMSLKSPQYKIGTLQAGKLHCRDIVSRAHKL